MSFDPSMSDEAVSVGGLALGADAVGATSLPPGPEVTTTRRPTKPAGFSFSFRHFHLRPRPSIAPGGSSVG